VIITCLSELLQASRILLDTIFRLLIAYSVVYTLFIVALLL